MSPKPHEVPGSQQVFHRGPWNDYLALSPLGDTHVQRTEHKELIGKAHHSCHPAAGPAQQTLVSHKRGSEKQAAMFRQCENPRLGDGCPSRQPLSSLLQFPEQLWPRRPPSLLPPLLLSTFLDRTGLARQIFVLGKSKHSHNDPVLEEPGSRVRPAKVSRAASLSSVGIEWTKALLDAGTPPAPGLVALLQVYWLCFAGGVRGSLDRKSVV